MGVFDGQCLDQRLRCLRRKPCVRSQTKIKLAITSWSPATWLTETCRQPHLLADHPLLVIRPHAPITRALRYPNLVYSIHYRQ